MSPLVWDLAHIGQQEELWLLRGGDPDRPGILPGAVEGLYDAFVHSRASRVDLPLLSPDQARVYCRTVRAASLDALDELPDEPEHNFVYGMVVSHENQHDETMLQALNLRTGPALLLESRDPAARPGGTCRNIGAGTRRPVRAGCRRRRRAILAGQRTPGSRRRRADLPHRPGPGHQRRMAAVHRRRRLRAAAVVVGAGLGAPPERGPDRAAVLERRRADPHPVRPRRRDPRRRTRPARQLFRGRGLRGLGRARGYPPSGNGRRPARGIRSAAHAGATRGVPGNRRRRRPTSAATRCVRHPSAPTPPALRPTGSSRCSAMSGNGPAPSCSPGRASPR